MSDRIPGSSYSNPIWYREHWRIYVYEPGWHWMLSYAFVHDDYDGEGDPRHGHGATVEACQREIDQIEAIREEDEREERAAHGQFGVGA